MYSANSFHFSKDSLIALVYRVQAFLNIRPTGIGFVTGCPRTGTSAMVKWLGTQKNIARFFESRTLIAAHRFLSAEERFESLHRRRTILIALIRQLVLKYYARRKYIWRKQIIDKEPLEPIALPDEDYSEFIANIRIIFPELKLIFMVREPVANIWSMVKRKWGYSLTDQKLEPISLEKSINIWNACSKLILDYADDKDVYVCRFERLIADPANESRHILNFLGLKNSPPFVPKPTSEIAFNESEREFILSETAHQRGLLDQISN